MPSIYDLERKFGWIAIPHLIRGIAIMQAICWALGYMNPDFWGALAFSRGAIFEGQVWRLISWVFVPLTSSPIFIIFATMILWMFGDIIESAWGAFRTTLYVLGGLAIQTAAGLLFLWGFPSSGLSEASWLLAVAILAPDIELRLFFILPVKLKWLGWITAVLLASGVFMLPVAWPATAAAVANFAIAFGPWLLRTAKQRQFAASRRREFKAKQARDPGDAFHRCAKCGKTDHDDHDAVFRVSSSDGKEYCEPCLEAIKADATSGA